MNKVTKLIMLLNKLPGRYARKTAFALLNNKSLLRELIVLLQDCHDTVKQCSKCNMYTESELCTICRSNQRDKSYLCIVSDVSNLMAIEKTRVFNGVYFVLNGLLSEHLGASDLPLDRLKDRIAEDRVSKVLIGLSPTTQGQATKYLLQGELESLVEVKTLSIGVALGSELEYLDPATIACAIE